MAISEITSPTRGVVGYLHEVECQDNQSILIFQLPRETKMLSNVYVEGAMDSIRKSLPPNRNALVIGCDVDVYELFGAEAMILKLKGLI